jgi:hypothetical protein
LRDFATENEDHVLAFLNVIHRIVRFCDAETAECGKIITERINEETAAGLTVADFESFWQNIELYATDANSAKEMILDESGVAYWKATWDSDNNYLVGTGAIPAPVDSESNFLMPQVWQAYVDKYGSSETGF